MATAVQSLQVYEDLSNWYDRQGQAKLRDWFLVLAADTATSIGENERCERLRKRLLHVNPHHVLKPFATFKDALKSPQVRQYVADLKKRYPLETAEQLLKASQKKRGKPEAPKAPEIKVVRSKLQADTRTPCPAVESPAAANPANPNAKRAAPTQKIPLALKWTRSRRVKTQTLVDSPDDSQPTREPAQEAEIDGLSAWISTVLVIATLLAGIGLALHTLASPIFSR